MSTASAIIHSVRLISSGLDHSDAFVAFDDSRVLATGIGSGWRELAGTDTEVLDGVGDVLTPGLLDIHNHGGAGASYGEDGDAIRRAMRLHRQHGTTRQRHGLDEHGKTIDVEGAGKQDGARFGVRNRRVRGEPKGDAGRPV